MTRSFTLPPEVTDLCRKCKANHYAF